MRAFSPSLILVVAIFSIPVAFGDDQEPALTYYQKVIRCLHRKEIRCNLPSDKMLDLCLPTLKRTLGRFTEYVYVFSPGYTGLSIIAKDGLVKRATEWSCTHYIRFFNELTPDDEKEYRDLCNNNLDVPFERFNGRWGWERPRMRDWMSDKHGPVAPQK